MQNNDKKKSFKIFFSEENYALYREKLSLYIVNQKTSILRLAKDIGIHFNTLKRFLAEEKTIKSEAFCKVVEFIDKFEDLSSE